ncbi:MAG: class I SAM-dependent methyltransferase, partial [Proteobacteria bacterium]|nr:class I SAM-dependent methyltransferase [Pseudomonadota bacterium]
QYLADSIMDFPSPEDLTAMMGRAGFDRTGFLKMTFGIATLHWGMRPDAESGPA